MIHFLSQEKNTISLRLAEKEENVHYIKKKKEDYLKLSSILHKTDNNDTFIWKYLHDLAFRGVEFHVLFMTPAFKVVANGENINLYTMLCKLLVGQSAE